MTYQLVKNGVVLKEHQTKLACKIEAIERHLVISWGVDFPGDKPGVSLVDGVEIREKQNVQ